MMRAAGFLFPLALGWGCIAPEAHEPDQLALQAVDPALSSILGDSTRFTALWTLRTSDCFECPGIDRQVRAFQRRPELRHPDAVVVLHVGRPADSTIVRGFLRNSRIEGKVVSLNRRTAQSLVPNLSTPDLLLVRGGTIEWRLSTPVAEVEPESGEALSTGVPNPLPWERQGPPEVSLRVGQLLRILRPGQPDTLDAVVGTIGDCWVGFPVDRTAPTPTAFSPLDPELFEEASVRISSEAVAEWPTEETAWSSLTWTELPHDQVRDFATCRP